MVPIISIVGKSDSGKTTLLEKLIPELNRRGYRVGTIKHDAHRFDIDHPGKDSWRHKQSGAEAVVISSPDKAALVKSVERELTLDEISQAWLQDVDIILTEGYKRESKPKIEVLADGERELLSPVTEIFLVAADGFFDLDMPVCGRDDVSGIVDVLEDRFLKNRDSEPGVEVIVDGQPIPLNGIMRAMVANTVVGLLSALKGVDDPDQIQIRLAGARKR